MVMDDYEKRAMAKRYGKPIPKYGDPDWENFIRWHHGDWEKQEEKTARNVLIAFAIIIVIGIIDVFVCSQ